MKTFRNLLFTAAFALCVLPAGAQAQENDSRVVVKVNGYGITAAEIALAADDILPQLREVPKNLRYPFVVEYLIERHLLAQAGRKAGLESSNTYKFRSRFYEAKAMRDSYFTDVIRSGVTDEIVERAYNEQASKAKPVDRVRARHIVLATKEDALKVIERLKAGEDFAELAKEVSTDGSKDFGGDLGYFTAAEMVPAFSEVTFALKVGQISKPVQTDFGWHVIKVVDRKKGGIQAFESVKNAIRLVLLRKAVQDEIVKLREGSNIEILDADLRELQKKAKEQQDKEVERRQRELDKKKGKSGKGDRVQ